MNEIAQQRAYYAASAGDYASLHEAQGSPHDTALEFVRRHLAHTPPETLLDVGAGTGRALRALSGALPGARLRGIEPVPELIAEAEKRGTTPGTITVGDANALPFADRSMDVVTAFGVLHHVREPSRVISEMFRVARRAVFISDSNRFAQGRPAARMAKLALAVTGLWPAFDFVRTRGRGYMVSEGDGLFYSYSVFDSLPQIRRAATRITLAEVERSEPAVGPFQLTVLNASTLLVCAEL